MPTIITKCEVCGTEIKHSSTQKRVTCSRVCQAKYFKISNKFKGEMLRFGLIIFDREKGEYKTVGGDK